MDKAKYSFLKEMDLFKDFSSNELERVEEIATAKSYPKGQVVYSPDDPADLLFILKKGKVKIYEISQEGKEFTLAILDGGSIFGEMVLVGQGMYDAFAEAFEDSELCVMNKNDVQELLLSYPKLALKVIEIMGNRLRQTEERLEELAFRDVTSRLASLLLRLAKNGSEAISGRPRLPSKFTHQELAEMIGTSRETLTRALGEFKAKNLVTIEHKQIQLLDIKGLERISPPSH